jgi:hypothetical protein
MDFNKLKNFDWRSLQKYTSAQSSEDLNRFLENLPQNAGQTMLVIAGICWATAGLVGLYTTVQMQRMGELSNELMAAEALQPVVPTLTNQAVDAGQIKKFVEGMSGIYKDLDIKDSGSKLTIKAGTTSHYGQFREALSHVHNGGDGWRLDVEELCVGRECKKAQLYASISINKVSVSQP